MGTPTMVTPATVISQSKILSLFVDIRFQNRFVFKTLPIVCRSVEHKIVIPYHDHEYIPESKAISCKLDYAENGLVFLNYEIKQEGDRVIVPTYKQVKSELYYKVPYEYRPEPDDLSLSGNYMVVVNWKRNRLIYVRYFAKEGEVVIERG